MTRSRRGWIFSPVALAALLLAAALALATGGRHVAAQALLVVNQISLDGFPEVVVAFTATDPAGLPIADIGKDRVQVIHNGQPVPTLALDLVDADQEGLAIGVAIDTSGSMEGAPLEHAKAAVRQLLDRMGPRDRLALVSFGVSGHPVQVVHDLTGDRAALNQALDSLVARGDTALYDGTLRAIELTAPHTLGRRAVVVITDGEDTHSQMPLEAAIGKARETNTSVSVIGFGDVKMDVIQRLATETGGTPGVAPNGEELAQRVAQFSERLRKQYVLRYVAPDSRQPENEVELVLDQGGEPVRAAQRFPAPPMPPLAVTLADIAPGSTVRGQIELRPNIANRPRVDRVEFLLDGASLHTATDPPYAFAWDTGAVPPGEHTLIVRAHLGDEQAEQTVPLVVGPAVQVTIKLPAPELSGRVRLTADIDSLAPVTGVTWTVDGQPIGAAEQPPFEIEWDSATVTTGEHTLVAEARDERGNVGRASQQVRVLQGLASPSPSPSPGGAGVQATATPGRGATATPTNDDESGGLSARSPALWIGGALVAALIGGIIYAASRRRDPNVIDGSVVGRGPGQPAGQGQPYDPNRPPAPSTSRMELPGPPGNPTYPGLPMAGSDALREGVTQGATILPHMPLAPVGGPGRASLVVTVPGSEPRTFPLGIDQIVGRAAGPGVIVISDPQVSRRHARISWEGGHFVYRDLGPMNPTRRAGRTLPNPYVLRDGDRLSVGRAELVFRG